jgi:hypothetical protein
MPRIPIHLVRQYGDDHPFNFKVDVPDDMPPEEVRSRVAEVIADLSAGERALGRSGYKLAAPFRYDPQPKDDQP